MILPDEMPDAVVFIPLAHFLYNLIAFVIINLNFILDIIVSDKTIGE